MTQATETALECVIGGILFCFALTLLLVFHKTEQEREKIFRGRNPQLILFEEEATWKHSEE